MLQPVPHYGLISSVDTSSNSIKFLEEPIVALAVMEFDTLAWIVADLAFVILLQLYCFLHMSFCKENE